MRNLNDIKLSRQQSTIAVAIILLIITTLGLRLYFDGKSYENTGPEFIVSNDKTVVLIYNNNLYRLDALGNINKQFPLSDLFSNPNSADIQLVDNNRFAIADWNSKNIYLCDFSGSACKPLTEKLGKHIRNHFKFFYREAHRDIFIADTDRHRVIHYDTTTHKVSKPHGAKEFLYPNHLQMEEDGYLYVTNTNHHRISRYKIENKKIIDIKKYSHVPNSVSSKKWPVFYYRLPNDDMFILQANDVLTYADLVLVKNNNETEKIPLPQDADITVVSRLGNSLLLLDRNLFAIHAMDLVTHEIHEFGGPDLLSLFTRDKRTRAGWASLSDLMMGLMILAIVGMAGFIIYLAVKGKREPAKTATDEASSMVLPPITTGKVTWLEPNPFFKKIFLGLVLLIIMMSATLYFLFQMIPIDSVDDETGTKFLAVMIGMATILVYALLMAAFNFFTRIGTDGIYIFVHRFGNQHKLHPREILYNKNSLVCNNISLIYKNQKEQYFHNKEQFDAYILPLLKTHARETGVMEIFKHKLHNPGLMDIVTVIFIGCGIYLLYFMYQHDMIFN